METRTDMGTELGKDEYYVKITSNNMVLPKICPVCGREATDTAIIGSISPEEQEKAERLREINRMAVGGFNRRPSLWTKPGSVKRIAVPVCDNHTYSIDEHARTRGIAAVVGGISLIAFLLSSISVILTLVRGIPIDPLWITIPVVSAIAIAFSYMALGPSSVEKAVSIEEFAPGGSYLILKITDRHYRDEVIRLNPMKARSVRKIRRRG